MEQQEFGVVIATCKHDYHLTKACCASIRHFMPGMPICLIADGDFSTVELENTYNVEVIRKQDVQNEFLAKNSYGWGLTKMIAFWEAPFKQFLLLDSDTIVWGDIFSKVDLQNTDAILDKPKYIHNEEEISYWFFNTIEVNKIFPKFNWKKYDSWYYCTGVTFCKKEIFEVDEYRQMLDLTKKTNSIFKLAGEMGFLNLMFMKNFDEGKISITQENIQIIMPDYKQSDLSLRFSFENGLPKTSTEDFQVLHFCGDNKAYYFTPFCYSKPVSYFRQRFIIDSKGKFSFIDLLMLLGEDAGYFYRIYSGKVRRKIKKLLKKMS